jgi:hypothetical protein
MGFGDQRAQPVAVARQVPAVVAGGLVLGIGHEGALMRPLRTHETHEVLQRVALDVEFAVGPGREQPGQIRHVMRADMPLIGPWMHGDAVRPRLQTQLGRAQDDGEAQVAPVAHLGHEIHVHGQRRLVHSDWMSSIIWRVFRVETPQW